MIEKTEQQKIFDTVFKQIEDAKKNKWNLCIPSMTISPSPESLFVPYLERVDMIVSPESKDYYKTSTGKNYRLHAQALNRIALAGELKWNNADSGYFKDPKDNSTIFRAVGGVVNSAGNIHQESGYYQLTLDDVMDDLRDHYTEKAKKDGKDQSYIDYCVNRDYRQKRQFRLQLTETSAKNRVIRKIFNIANEYSIEQLKLPFLVLKFSIYMDYKDPIVKQMVLGMKIQAALGVYGINPQPALPAPMSMGIPAPMPMDINLDDDPNIIEPEDDPGFTDDMPDDDMPPSDEVDFKNCEDAEQVRVLRALSKQVGVPVSEIRLSSDPKYVSQRLDLFKFLKSKIKPEEPITIPEDEIPF